jgi:hypothetical protein
MNQAETTNAYQAVHDHATVLWLYKPRTFFQLPGDLSKAWARLPDPDWGAGYIYRDEDLIPQFRKFQIPAGRLPPYSGVAYRWLKEPQNWEWIGWRVWDCYFQPGQVFYQTFEKGIMLGPFLHHQANPARQVFILLDGKPWASEESDVRSECESPPYSVRP